MSLYNMIYGVTPATFLILPMLGKHPDEYPRFRDCFLEDKEHSEYNNHIHIYTRVGGLNRNCGMGEDELYKHPNYVATFDDSFDNTYATYIFSVPEKWGEDFKKIINNKLNEVSKEYQEEVMRIYPELKDKLIELFKEVKND
ncbi:MAG: hypothetical protein ACFFG0_02380 [Candidatus Thorarchaeota archaeon]